MQLFIVVFFSLHSLTGPVFVEFPIDVLYPYEMVKREIGMKDKGPIGLAQRIVNW